MTAIILSEAQDMHLMFFTISAPPMRPLRLTAFSKRTLWPARN